jgi:hypothetical protein
VSEIGRFGPICGAPPPDARPLCCMIPRHAGPHSWETLPPEQIDPATMHAAARWLDAEYLRYAMLVPKGDGAQEIDGRMTALAQSSALFRQWADSGRRPPHHPVSEDTERAYWRRCSEEP